MKNETNPLLVMLIGGVIRSIKGDQVDDSVTKGNHLELDYSGTMEAMCEMCEKLNKEETQ